MRTLIILVILLIFFFSPVYAEMYKWVDEKGTQHFTDDLSNIPEKYRPEAEVRKAPKESPVKEIKGKSPSFSPLKTSEGEAIEVRLIRRHELLLTEVVLNGMIKDYFIVDTGASFTLISRQIASQLGITIDENTPFIRVTSASDILLTPLVNLKSVRVGKAEVNDVETLIHNMPNYQGLLGNSFLNKFKVTIDSLNNRMILFPIKGLPSPDRPGGYDRDYWVGQFRFYIRNLEELRRLKTIYENRGLRSETARIKNAIRYFENQLNELERRASLAGVPRNWRE
jgi:clan AA aspartic protease (TIGR02281 family)